MFEEYLADSSHFIAEGRRSARDDEAEARRSYRLATMLGVSAMETFINFIASTFAEAGDKALANYELALLLDRRFGQSNGKFEMWDQVSYSRLEDKLRFLADKFGMGVVQQGEWAEFFTFKRLRDSLVHSRSDYDEKPVSEYDAECVRGLTATFVVMNAVSQGIFRRPLRRKLHDLVEF